MFLAITLIYFTLTFSLYFHPNVYIQALPGCLSCLHPNIVPNFVPYTFLNIFPFSGSAWLYSLPSPWYCPSLFFALLPMSLFPDTKYMFTKVLISFNQRLKNEVKIKNFQSDSPVTWLGKVPSLRLLSAALSPVPSRAPTKATKCSPLTMQISQNGPSNLIHLCVAVPSWYSLFRPVLFQPRIEVLTFRTSAAE